MDKEEFGQAIDEMLFKWRRGLKAEAIAIKHSLLAVFDNRDNVIEGLRGERDEARAAIVEWGDAVADVETTFKGQGLAVERAAEVHRLLESLAIMLSK